MKNSTLARMANLLAYFGWQGGTIHQLAEVTGVDGNTLLHADAPNNPTINSAYIAGQTALSTCDVGWRVKRLAPKRQGNVEYWLGVADCWPLIPAAKALMERKS